MKNSLQEWMALTGVAFGTSGARGLATAMTDKVCYAYTKGFLQYLESIGELQHQHEEVAVAGDFRPSTDRIMNAVCAAIEDQGYRPVNCGKIPSPAVALYGLTNGIPSIMVTGSHIPDDRNGIKFNKCSGEVLKEDEKGMAGQIVELNDQAFDATGNFSNRNPAQRPIRQAVADAYIARYLSIFPPNALAGMRVGVYQHSAVGRDVILKILSALGAETVALGRSEKFIPVDTEAIRPEDAQLARDWAAQSHFDALASADGDSDRPLISDERGEWLRGDVAGILCARFLRADSISTPVSCNTAVEKCGWFKEIRRTRIGSPYVVASMLRAAADGAKRAVGYEANGGFLIQSDLEISGKTLRALPTRDAVIVLLSILLQARQQGKTISALTAELPARFTASDRLQNVPIERSAAFLARFHSGNAAADRATAERVFGKLSGQVSNFDRTDGLRITFANDEIIHLRPSGNAPEFRCYTEAATDVRAKQLDAQAINVLRRQLTDELPPGSGE